MNLGASPASKPRMRQRAGTVVSIVAALFCVAGSAFCFLEKMPSPADAGPATHRATISVNDQRATRMCDLPSDPASAVGLHQLHRLARPIVHHLDHQRGQGLRCTRFDWRLPDGK